MVQVGRYLVIAVGQSQITTVSKRFMNGKPLLSCDPALPPIPRPNQNSEDDLLSPACELEIRGLVCIIRGNSECSSLTIQSFHCFYYVGSFVGKFCCDLSPPPQDKGTRSPYNCIEYESVPCDRDLEMMGIPCGGWEEFPNIRACEKIPSPS